MQWYISFQFFIAVLIWTDIVHNWIIVVRLLDSLVEVDFEESVVKMSFVWVKFFSTKLQYAIWFSLMMRCCVSFRVACICWTFHYAKRLLETVFVHRFSHATMPIRNIFKVKWHRDIIRRQFQFIISNCSFVFVLKSSEGQTDLHMFCLWQNSAYYWGFAAFVAYFNNHPLYTPPCES